MGSRERFREGASLLAAGFFALVATVGEAAVTCQHTEGPVGQQTMVRVDILDPAPGATIPPSGPCGQDVLVTGTIAVTGPSADFDVYVVVDGSSSTDGDSDADVDGDGFFGGPGDTIYLAEIAAARQFVAALDPAHVRVAVIRFNSTASLEQALSADLASVDATLDAMRLRVPFSTTAYLPAMQAVEDEVLARGDVNLRQQRCVFLSDGRQDETLAEIDVAAADVAALDVVMDTFALGFSNSQALQHMATITGGTFTHLATPGEIVAILPSFAPDPTPALAARNDQSPVPAVVSLDADLGTFSALVRLAPGSNHVVLTLSTQNPNPVSVECAIDLFLPPGLVADAGPDRSGCEGQTVVLDGSASNTSGCSTPVYHWLDCTGAEACPPSASPTCEVPACSSCDTYRLEVSCAGQPCVEAALAQVGCLPQPPLVPVMVSTCALGAALSCGGDVALDNAWDLDALRDRDGDGDPRNDRDIAGCDVLVYFMTVGAHGLVALSRDASGCEAAVDLVVTVAEPPPPAEVRVRACRLEAGVVSCGVPDASSTYWWDVETDVDLDGDGDPGNDADVAGCDAPVAWSVAGLYEVAGWQRDAFGCTVLIVHGQVEVADIVPVLLPRVRKSCLLSVDVECGGDPLLENSWDLDAAADSDGDGDPIDDADVVGCNVTLDLPAFGIHDLVALSRSPTGCEAAANLRVTLVEPPAPTDIQGGICPFTNAELSCGVPDRLATYWWDVDARVDSDGDGDPSNDADELGCDVTVSWGVEGSHDIAGWKRDATGCVVLIAQGTLEVSTTASPGETPDLRVGRDGVAVRFEWGGVPGAVDYRLARGTIASLWLSRAYDHAADDASDAGTCSVGGTRSFTDDDDAADDVSYYYLVTAVNDCAGEGTAGNAWNGRQRPQRPARIPTASCP